MLKVGAETKFSVRGVPRPENFVRDANWTCLLKFGQNLSYFWQFFFNVSIASGNFFGMFLTNFEKKHRNSVLFSLLFSENPQILKISRYLGASDSTAVHCALCTVQNKVFSVLYAFFSVQCAVCNRQCVV